MADPGCLARIPDPKTAMKDIGEKNLLSYLFFGVINFTKFNYFIFEMLKKKIWANFQRTGKNLFRIPDPGVKKALDPGSGSATLEVSSFDSNDTRQKIIKSQVNKIAFFSCCPLPHLFS